MELSCLTGIQPYRKMEVLHGNVLRQEMTLSCLEIRMMIRIFARHIKKVNLQKKKSEIVPDIWYL